MRPLSKTKQLQQSQLISWLQQPTSSNSIYQSSSQIDLAKRAVPKVAMVMVAPPEHSVLLSLPSASSWKV